MPHVADTARLVADGVISEAQAAEIARRSRETMVALVVNIVLCAGILAATAGLVFWLADATSVAVAGLIFLIAGIAVLARGGADYRMFGNAAALIGAGLLIFGAGIELATKHAGIAGPAMLCAGAVVALTALRVQWRGPLALHFALGALALMGAALHLWGGYFWLEQASVTGLSVAFYHIYAAAVIAWLGWRLDVRLVTAAAIVPFAQALDTGTFYFHAAYVFYSPEPTLTILQMAALAGVILWLVRGRGERDARHAGILAILAVVVGNLAFLVGSLWGDRVGMSLFRGDAPVWSSKLSFEEWDKMQQAWQAQFPHIPAEVFAVVWAVLLIAGALWAAHGNRRGLFNAAVTFGAIHAYTQVFESFGDEPLAYALAGLAAIPVAWGMWRLNLAMAARVVAERGPVAASGA